MNFVLMMTRWVKGGRVNFSSHDGPCNGPCHKMHTFDLEL